jgi:hypothetical protein
VFAAHRDAPTQLQEVVRAILLDPEARGDFKDPAVEPNYGKLREPVLFIMTILRAFNATSDGVLDLLNIEGSAIGSASMSQDVFRAPSVFNFYPPTARVPGAAGVLGPQFAIFSSLTSLRRDNFVNRVIFATIPTNSSNRPTGTSIDLSVWDALGHDPDQLITALNELLLHGTMSEEMRHITAHHGAQRATAAWHDVRGNAAHHQRGDCQYSSRQSAFARADRHISHCDVTPVSSPALKGASHGPHTESVCLSILRLVWRSSPGL